VFPYDPDKRFVRRHGSRAARAAANAATPTLPATDLLAAAQEGQ
jgi:hypothetical protein